jgi:hypothetical protein
MYHNYRQKIEQAEGSLDKFSKGYEYMGFHQASDGTITYREWAQSADRVWLIGDFSMCILFAMKALQTSSYHFVHSGCFILAYSFPNVMKWRGGHSSYASPVTLPFPSFAHRQLGEDA